MTDGNFIKINRKILEWEWWGNINVSRLFIWMLLKANWKDGKFQGLDIKRGSFVSSYPKMEAETGLTVNEIRTAILKLKSTGEITVKSQAKFSVFTIKNYDLYQDINSQNNSQTTGKSQSINSLLTTIEERKEIKKERSNIGPARLFKDFFSAYPKSGNRIMTEQAYAMLLSSTDNLSEEELLVAAKNYAESCQILNTQKQFVKNPENWLRDSSWINYMPDKYKKPENKQAAPKENRFNNFEQRHYDFDELERKLLAGGD